MSARPGRDCRTAVLGLLFAVALVFLTPNGFFLGARLCIGQENEKDASETALESPIATLDLSASDYQGRALRPIGVYQSQLVDLVPKNFRPISLSELQSMLEASQVEVPESATKTPLVSSFFDVRLSGDLLTSDFSTIVLDNSLAVSSQRNLGAVNLALRPVVQNRIADPPVVDSQGVEALPRLLVDDRGELIADVEAADSQESKRSELSFGWTFRGQQVGDVVKFSLRLPRTPQTRMVISVPRDVQIETAQGVLIESPGPPPDADLNSRAGDIHWYVLEAGGLGRVDLIARKVSESEATGAILVRRESKQYEIDLAGVLWTHRLTFELPDHRRTIRLRCALGTISNVRVSPLGARHEVFPRTDGQSIIEVRLPEIVARPVNSGRSGLTRLSSGHLVTLTISGNSTWNLAEGRCHLPSVDFVEPNVIWTEPTTQADVTVLKPLRIARWELPADWQQAIQTPTRDDEVFLVAQGPPHATVIGSGSGNESSSEKRGKSSSEKNGVVSTLVNSSGDSKSVLRDRSSSWSQVRLSTDSAVSFEEAWFELALESANSSELKGRGRFRCRSLRQQIVPIEFDIEPGWNIESVQIVGSGRQIVAKRNASQIIVWPTANEFASELFEIEIVGTRKLVRSRVDVSTPATWMVRPHHAVASQIVSLVPPKLRRWDSESVMLRERINDSELPSDAIGFFQPAADRLLLRRPFGDVPSVTVEPTDDSAEVTLRCEIGRKENSVTQEIVLRTETSRPVFSVTVLTGRGTFDDIPYRWSLRKLDGSSTMVLSASSVTHAVDDPLGKYEIDLENRDLREFELIGSRVALAEGMTAMTFALPSVREASSETAEVIVSADWMVVASDSVGQSASVQRVPVAGGEIQSNFQADLAHRLRYDPAMRPSITIAAAKPNAATCLIWEQSLEVIAGSRMEDIFRLVASVSSNKPIEFFAPAELSLEEAVCNGDACEVERRGDGSYRINPTLQSDTIALTFRRFHSSHSWFRKCEIPSITIKGEVMHQTCLVKAAPGSVIVWPASDTELFLMPRNFSLGLGWLAAAALFCIAWSFSRLVQFGPQILFVCVLLAFSASIIWWPWQLPLLAWVALPMAVAALLNSVVRRPLTKDVIELEHGLSQNANGNGLDESTDHSRAFSVSTPLGFLLCSFAGLLAESYVGDSACMAQSVVREMASRSPSSSPSAKVGYTEKVDVLVPMSESGERVGDKVYLSKQDYQLLLDDSDPNRPANALFESADYRVELSRSLDSSDRGSVATSIQADYQIRLSGPKRRKIQSGSIRLPFRAETLRRVELLGDDQTRIVRSTVDENGLVTVPLPPGESFRLRVTFSPNIVQSNRSGEPVDSDVDSEVVQSNEERRSERRDNGTDESGNVKETLTEISLTIPKIHNARLLIESSREIRVESVKQPLGKELNRVEIGRYEADLGPSEELRIRCFPVSRASGPRAASLNRRYRISAGLVTTVIECEIDPPVDLSSGDSFQLNVVGPRADSVSGLGWQIQEVNLSGRSVGRDIGAGELAESQASSVTGASGGAYRLTRQANSQEPIRFIWQLPSLLNVPTSVSDSAPMTIPEVRGVGGSRLTSTVFAVEAADQIRMTELTNDSSAVAIDEFLEAWRGYRGAVERVFQTQKEFPNLVLFRRSIAEPELTLRHDLHVAEKSMVLELKADLVDVRSTINRTTWQLPPGFRLLTCRVNGDDASDWALVPRPLPADKPFGGKEKAVGAEKHQVLMDLALGDQRVNDRMYVEIVGRIDRPQRGLVELPRIEPSLAGQRNQIYRITRDRNSTVELVPRSKTSGLPMGDRWKSIPTLESDLVLGRVPVSEYRWISTITNLGSESDQLRVALRRNSVVFPCSQTTVMRYVDGRWTCDALFEIPKARCPDFVDLQIPRRWTADVSVSDAESWVKEDSEDKANSIIRVSCRQNAPEEQMEKRLPDNDSMVRFVVSGTLDGSDQARVSVPKIRVLGAGQRNVAIAVPDRLTTEPIQWRTTGVLASRLAEKWFSFAGDRITSPELYSFYSVNKRSWTVDLEPLSRASVEPTVSLSDTRVFLGGREALVLQRFDLSPETLRSISVKLATGAECVGVWAAGREVSIETNVVDRQGENVDRGASIEVPLAFSQLPQSIELISRVPLNNRRLLSCDATIEGVKIESSWVAYYEHKAAAERHVVRQGKNVLSALPEQVSDWELALAESVVDTMERSSDMLAERSRDEVAAWLIPWIARFREVSNQEPDRRDAASTDQERWGLVSTEMSSFAGRFLTSQQVVPRPLFSRQRWSRYSPIAIVHRTEQDEQPVVKQEHLQSNLLRDLMIKTITLLMVLFAVVAMWPFRGNVTDLIVHPAVWLAMVGLVCMLITPQPVGGLIILLAVFLPAIAYLNSKKPWRESLRGSSPSQVQ